MIHKIICIVKVEAPTEEEGKKRILQASAYEKWFGLTIEPVNFKKGFKDGSKDRKPEDPMPSARIKVRREQGQTF